MPLKHFLTFMLFVDFCCFYFRWFPEVFGIPVNFVKVVPNHRMKHEFNGGKMLKKTEKNGPTFINIHWSAADKPNLWIQFQYGVCFVCVCVGYFAIEKLFTAFANFSTSLRLCLSLCVYVSLFFSLFETVAENKICK